METTYRLPLDSISSGWKGNLGFHAQVTHYISDVIDSGAINSIPTQNAGVNAGSTGLPSWKYQAAVDYAFDHYSLQLSARGISSGVYNQSNIECTSGCPASTSNNVTVSNNRISGVFYLDLGATYHFTVDKADAAIYFNVRNLLNRDPPIVAMGPGATGYDFFPANAALYDVLGRVLRLGVRLEM
jgi:iron complex outermembrane receptor protein